MIVIQPCKELLCGEKASIECLHHARIAEIIVVFRIETSSDAHSASCGVLLACRDELAVLAVALTELLRRYHRLQRGQPDRCREPWL